MPTVEFRAAAHGGERPWVVIGFSRDGGTNGDPARAVGSLAEIAAAEIDAVVVLTPRLESRFRDSEREVLADLPQSGSGIVVLIPYKPPPWPEARVDSLVTTFACTAGFFRALLALEPRCPWHQLCFSALHAVMNGTVEVDRLVARQLPYPRRRPLVEESANASVIMPHRGRRRHLNTALHYLSRDQEMLGRIRVGLDMSDPSEYGAIAARYPQAEFYSVQPAPVGPYVIRQELAQRSAEPLLVLQDSDDLSCSDRFSVQRAEMQATRCDMVGCHELRVDEILREVVAIRFPLDVTGALNERAGHALLHATGMITNAGYMKAGGLSTDQHVANDTQFLFRAFFKLRIRNSDAFLYLRRRHSRSLTCDPATGNGIRLRLELDARWRADFRAVKRGRLALEHSSLRPTHCRAAYRIALLSTFGEPQPAEAEEAAHR